MAVFSFDIVSEYDKAEMNNVFAGAEREIANRYDFKGTPAGIEWIEGKKGLKIIGSNEWQIEAIIDIVRKKLAGRNQSAKVLDLTSPIQESNLKATKQITFKEGLDQEKAKQITKMLREKFPKAKAQIQGEAVRVSSASKDELQSVMKVVQEVELAFPVSFTNYR